MRRTTDQQPGEKLPTGHPDRTLDLYLLALRLGLLIFAVAVPLYDAAESGPLLLAALVGALTACIPYYRMALAPHRPLPGLLYVYLLDLVWITCVLLVSGPDAPMYGLLYPFAVISAALTGGVRAAMSVLMVSALLYVSLVLHPLTAVPSTLADGRSWGLPLLLLALLLLLGWTGIALALRRRYGGLSPQLAVDLLAQLFHGTHAGLIVLNAPGRIVAASNLAHELLDCSGLLGKPWNDFQATLTLGEQDEGNANRQYGYLRRTDGQLFAAAIERAPLASIGRDAFPEGYDLIIFIDISGIMRGHAQAHIANRDRMVEKIVSIIGDGIRNPVAGISCATQLLNILEAEPFPLEHGKRSTREQERAKLCSQIVRDAERLDRLMEIMLSAARVSPEQLDRQFADLKAQFADSSTPDPINPSPSKEPTSP